MKTPDLLQTYRSSRHGMQRGAALILLMIIAAVLCIIVITLQQLQYTAIINLDYHEAELRAQAQADNALTLLIAQIEAGSLPPDKLKVPVNKTVSGYAVARRLSNDSWQFSVVGQAHIWEASCPPGVPPTVCVRLEVRAHVSNAKSNAQQLVIQSYQSSSRFEEPQDLTLP